MKRLTLSSLLMAGCSLLLRREPFCGDGIAQEGEVCFNQEVLQAQNAPATVLVVDIDDDDDLDIINSNLSADVTLFRNDGTGQFEDFEILQTADIPSQIVTGDFNEDGRLDIAAACAGIPQNGVAPPSIVTFLLQEANGGFSALEVTLNTVLLGQTLAVDDINGDNNLDLAVVGGQSQNAVILFGDGNAVFTQLEIPLQSNPLGVYLADLNDDNRADLVVLDSLINGGAAPGDSITLFSGQDIVTQLQAGTPAPSTVIEVGIQPQFAAIEDLDDDGSLDLAITGLISNDVTLLFNDGGAAFTFEKDTFQAGNAPIAVSIVDINQDGVLDVLSTNLDNELLFHLNDGAQSFTTLAPFAVGQAPQLFSVGDLDGDELLEVVVPNTGEDTLSLLRGTP